MGPARIHVTKVIEADEKSARAWGHCTVRGCKATMTCRIGWQPDHAIFTCFKLKEHHHPVHLGCNRREAIDLAASLSHNPPLRASAELLGRILQYVHLINRLTQSTETPAGVFLEKQPVRTVATRDGAYSGYAMGLWAQASMHSYSAGSSSQHLPKIESIPMAHQWNPKESVQTGGAWADHQDFCIQECVGH